MDDTRASRISEVMTTRELAELLHVHVNSVERFARTGEIPAFRVGGQWRFELEEIERWIVGLHKPQ